MANGSRSSLITIVVGVVIVVGALVWLFMRAPKDTNSDSSLLSRTGIHWHAQITITVDGKEVIIPDDTGLVGANAANPHAGSPLHTHAGESNKIHMEYSSVVRQDDVKLGKFFEVWGEELSSTQLMDKTTADGGTLVMKVNGQESTAFGDYIMQDGDTMELIFTSASSEPAAE